MCLRQSGKSRVKINSMAGGASTQNGIQLTVKTYRGAPTVSNLIRHTPSKLHTMALSRISPRVRVRVSVSIVYRIGAGGYSCIWPTLSQAVGKVGDKKINIQLKYLITLYIHLYSHKV